MAGRNQPVQLSERQIEIMNIVWERGTVSLGGPWDILFYDGSEVECIGMGFDPDISGPNIVWSGEEDGDWEITYFDGTATYNLTDNSVHDDRPKISDTTIVWKGWDGHDYEIFTCTVPEPASLSLLACGGLPLLRKRRLL